MQIGSAQDLPGHSTPANPPRSDSLLPRTPKADYSWIERRTSCLLNPRTFHMFICLEDRLTPTAFCSFAFFLEKLCSDLLSHCVWNIPLHQSPDWGSVTGDDCQDWSYWFSIFSMRNHGNPWKATYPTTLNLSFFRTETLRLADSAPSLPPSLICLFVGLTLWTRLVSDLQRCTCFCLLSSVRGLKACATIPGFFYLLKVKHFF